jgi:hypothetical protein
LLLTNPRITYCPIAKIITIAINTAISEKADLIPPAEVANPTTELSTTTAMTTAIMMMKILLFPILNNDERHQR